MSRVLVLRRNVLQNLVQLMSLERNSMQAFTRVKYCRKLCSAMQGKIPQLPPQNPGRLGGE
jgi:hypothetical protein